MINGMQGHMNGDAAWHREQRCNQDCNQGRNCDCRRPDISDIAIRDEKILDLKQEVEILIMQRDELVAALRVIADLRNMGKIEPEVVAFAALAKIEANASDSIEGSKHD